MRKESWLSPKCRRGLLLAAGVGLAAYFTPQAHINAVGYLGTAIAGGVVDCSNGVNDSLIDKPFDVYAIADGGYADDPRVPGPITRRNIQVAAGDYVDAHKHGQVPEKIVFLAGPKKQSPNVNRLYFEKQVKKLNPTITIPQDTFKTDNSLNTSEGVAVLADIFDDGEHQRLAAYTADAQANRFAALACAHGMPTRVFRAEKILMAEDPSRAPALKAMLNSDLVIERNETELWKMATLPFFPKGEALTLAKEKWPEIVKLYELVIK